MAPYQPHSAVPHLPNEVMIKILSYVALSRDLASVALASRNVNALVQDFLYRSISLNFSYSKKDFEISIHTREYLYARFYRLIDRLSAKRELGHAKLRDDENHRLQTVALSVTGRTEGRYAVDVLDRLIQHLPNLQHVTFDPPPLMCREPSGFCPSSIRLDFQHLRDHDEEREDVLIKTVFRGLFQLPGLRELIFENLDFHSDQAYDLFFRTGLRYTLGSGYLPLEDLRFIDCHDENNGINFECTIASIKALKRFVFVTETPAELFPEDRFSSLGGIARALIPYMARLEEFVLSPCDGTYGGYLQREWYINHCFTNLRRVALPKCLLIQDIDRRAQCLLPRTVEEVQIQFTLPSEDSAGPKPNDSAREANVAAVEWLLTAKTENLPHLRRVIWWYQPWGLEAPEIPTVTNWNSCYGSLPELQRIGKQFNAVEVLFEWTLVGLFRDTPFGRRLSE